MYRPKEWKKNPCEDCPDKIEDEYGLLCNLPCGKNTAWLNSEAGADAMLEALSKEGVVRKKEELPIITKKGWYYLTEPLIEE